MLAFKIISSFSYLFDHHSPILSHQNSKVSSGYAETTAQLCMASGLGLTRGVVGEPAQFSVHTGNAGVGELVVKISSPTSSPIVVIN